MAARSYFGKSAKDLTLAEGAMLAGLLKGPSYFNPDRHPDRAKERLGYVLGRMQEDGVISAAQKDSALAEPPKLVAFERPRRDIGFRLRRFRRPRGEVGRRASLTAATLHGAFDHQRDLAARHRSGAAGGPRALRDATAGSNFTVPRPISPTPCRNSAP